MTPNAPRAPTRVARCLALFPRTSTLSAWARVCSIADMKMAAGPDRAKLQALELEKEDAQRKLADFQIKLHDLTQAADEARQEAVALGKAAEERATELRASIARENEAAEAATTL